MTEHQDHEAKADEVERELDDMEETSDRLQDEIERTGDDWERKKRDAGVPGAAGMPSEAQGSEPERRRRAGRGRPLGRGHAVRAAGQAERRAR